MPPRRSWVLVCLVAVSGCGEERGRDPFVTAPVRGRVRFGARPLTRGWIEFSPVDGARGSMRSSPIAPDGSFAVDAVAVGTNTVGFVNIPADPAIGRFFDPLSTPMRRTVAPGGPGIFEIDLEEEVIRWQAHAVRIEP